MATGGSVRPVLRIARVVLTAAVLAALGLALARRWDEVRPLLDQLSPAAAVGAFGYCLLGLVASMLAWRALLGDLGNPLPVRPATRVLFLGQLAKYLPGSTVWAVLAQTELAHDYGVPRKRAASAGIVLNLVTLGVGLLVALLALPELLSDGAPRWLHWSPVLVPLGLACLTPPVLTWICNLVFRVLRRPPLDVTFSWTGVGIAVLSLLGTWLAYGLQITLLGWSLGADPGDLLLPATGAFAAAWCAGFLVVVVPTGAGTREAVLTLALASLLPGGTAAALTVAVLSRLLLTLADVAAALIGVVLGRGTRVAPEPADEPGQPTRSG